ncbi:sodium-dependent glucose transporter 1-like [Haemaphysalis longicornis]
MAEGTPLQRQESLSHPEQPVDTSDPRTTGASLAAAPPSTENQPPQPHIGEQLFPAAEPSREGAPHAQDPHTSLLSGASPSSGLYPVSPSGQKPQTTRRFLPLQNQRKASDPHTSPRMTADPGTTVATSWMPQESAPLQSKNPQTEGNESSPKASPMPTHATHWPATASTSTNTPPQDPRKLVTVADVADIANKRETAVPRKWTKEYFLESTTIKKSHLEASHRERAVKATQTLGIHLSFFGAGMYYAMFGPTIQDLAVTLNASLLQVLFLLAARGAGFFLGAVVSGVFLRGMNPQVLLMVLDFFLGVACIGVYYFDTLFQSELLFGLGGFSMGGIKVSGVLWLSALWRETSGFMIQTLSFVYCMGCVLGPVMGEPFVTQRSVLQPPFDPPAPAERQLAYLTSLEDKNLIYVAYAYWLVGLYVFAVLFLALATFFVDPRHQELSPVESQRPVVPCSGLVIVLFIYLAAYVAMETVYSQLTAAFALLLGHSKTTAAYVTSLFWAALTTVRGVSIIWLQQQGSFNMLICCNFFLVVVTALEAVFGDQSWALWMGPALAGACMAPVMPSTLLLLHDYSGVSTGRFVCVMLAVGASSAFAPLGLGWELERLPMLFHYGVAALAVLSLCIIVFGKKLAGRMAIESGYALLSVDEGQETVYRHPK